MSAEDHVDRVALRQHFLVQYLFQLLSLCTHVSTWLLATETQGQLPTEVPGHLCQFLSEKS